MDNTAHWWDDVDFIPQQVKMLQRGDEGDPVRRIQTQLREAGYSIGVDGQYGPATVRAVQAFQRDHDLVVDGRVGPKTQWRINRAPKDPRVLTQEDLAFAADRLGVPVASVMAVNSVESRGSGFFSTGEPAILYERHIMYRRLREHELNPNVYEAQFPNLVNRSTGGYHGGPDEHNRLSRAREIHDSAALESASWGLFQIMGFHWKRLGYASAQDFVTRMQQGERQQLAAFVAFIEADPRLHEALKARDWTTFARYYNGPAYAKNHYDIKLASAFDTFATPA